MLQSGEQRRAAGLVIAHGAVPAATLWLFSMADSASSLGCFLVGGALMVLTRGQIALGLHRPKRYTLLRCRGSALRPMTVHVLAAAMVSVGVYGVLVNTDVGLVQAAGRNPTLTTRTELSAALLRIPVNPLFETGFESF